LGGAGAGLRQGPDPSCKGAECQDFCLLGHPRLEGHAPHELLAHLGVEEVHLRAPGQGLGNALIELEWTTITF
jgi:hypothetical protein